MPHLDRHLYRAWLRLAAQAGMKGSVWVSLGRVGGDLYVSLAEPWSPSSGRELSSSGSRGEKLMVGPDGHVWVNDSVPGDGVVLRVAAGRSAEVCALASPAARGSFVTKL